MPTWEVRFATTLGEAALKIWSELPRGMQERLFEMAVLGQPDLRNPLAIYLHRHHPRTVHPPRPSMLD